MPKLTLYHAAPSRSSDRALDAGGAGEPYDIHLLSLKKGENLQARIPGRSIRWARCRPSSTAT